MQRHLALTQISGTASRHPISILIDRQQVAMLERDLANTTNR